jgi:hypothetical protein
MSDDVQVCVRWNLEVKTQTEIPADIWEQGQDAVRTYVMKQCDMSSATKTRVAGGFIVGQVEGSLEKSIGDVTELAKSVEA